MSGDFYFEKREVGRFIAKELPTSAGRHAYEPFVVREIPRHLSLGKPDKPTPSGHPAMLKALKSEEKAVCYYNIKDARVFFTVSASPQEGILEICDVEIRPWLVPSIIAQQLAGIYQELTEKCPFSEIVRIPLAEAGASGRARRLVILQCDTELLGLPGIIRRWWTVDASGIHPDGDWPLSTELLSSVDGQCENPVIRFATDGQRVLFGLRLGTLRGCENRPWYASRQAALGADGKFVPDELVEIYSNFTHDAAA